MHLGSIWFYTVVSTIVCHCMYDHVFVAYIYVYTLRKPDPNPHSPKKYALIRPFEGTPLWNYPSWFVFAMPMPLFCARSVVPIRCVPHPRNWVWTCRRSSKAFFQPTCSLRKRRISEKSCWNCLWSRKRLGVSPTLSVLDSTFVYTVYIYILWPTPPVKQKVQFPLPIGMCS